mmetsp:Transcript_26680/g.63228  ORF Transcript_26680/g.63228 Transcript_26680/m.63228 type:complete len:249 (+) Transcript_26680:110-856(+)
MSNRRLSKYKSFMKFWEIDEKQIQPYPEGILTDFTAGADSAWREIMGYNSRWKISADETRWAKRLRELACSVEEISQLIDSNLFRIENQMYVPCDIANVVDEKVSALLAALEHHHESVITSVVNILTKSVKASTELAKVEEFKRAHTSWGKKAKLLRVSVSECSKHMAEGLAKDLNRTKHWASRWVFLFRMLKDKFDVFQSVMIVAMEQEIQNVMFLARKYLSRTTWEKCVEANLGSVEAQQLGKTAL